MNKDFSELVEYLDGKFVKIDERFEKIDKRFDVTEEQIDQCAKQKDLDILKERVDSLITSIDKLVKLITDYHQEQMAIKAKMDIHEKWIFQLAEKLGLKLQE